MADYIATLSTDRNKKIILIILVVAALPMLYYNVSVGQDWFQFFRPATLALVHGQNPYDIRDFNNAPWTLIPFIPFVLLPYQIGRVGFFLLSFICFIYIPYKLGAKPVSLILFVTSYPVISCLNGGGIEWLPMLSFVTPAPVSLIFAAMKPQIGIGMALYWLFESWRLGGIRMIVKNFLPVTLMLLVSFVLYGFWILTFVGKSENIVNMSLFPYTVPVGLYLLWAAISQRHPQPAMAASPFFAPYHTLFTLAGPLVALLDYPKLLAFISACFWALGAVRAWVFFG
ncbi:MAG TPA: hypothetical protein VK206_27760 [Anaerolineales bacterium]|nr:hypothetical protein [Anaerolineales bacterium]